MFVTVFARLLETKSTPGDASVPFIHYSKTNCLTHIILKFFAAFVNIFQRKFRYEGRELTTQRGCVKNIKIVNKTDLTTDELLESTNSMCKIGMTNKRHFETSSMVFGIIFSEYSISITRHINRKFSFHTKTACRCLSFKKLYSGFARLVAAVGNSFSRYWTLPYEKASPFLYIFTPVLLLASVPIGVAIASAQMWPIRVSEHL